MREKTRQVEACTYEFDKDVIEFKKSRSNASRIIVMATTSPTAAAKRRRSVSEKKTTENPQTTNAIVYPDCCISNVKVVDLCAIGKKPICRRGASSSGFHFHPTRVERCTIPTASSHENGIQHRSSNSFGKMRKRCMDDRMRKHAVQLA